MLEGYPGVPEEPRGAIEGVPGAPRERSESAPGMPGECPKATRDAEKTVQERREAYRGDPNQCHVGAGSKKIKLLRTGHSESALRAAFC